MQLSRHQAQDIVDEIGQIVKKEISLMDEDGYVIACTDRNRIGTFHAGAKKIIDEGLYGFYVSPQDSTDFMRTGVNLPITFLNKIVGVIGINGEYDQIISLGRVVKKMTEILIREKVEGAQKRLDERVYSRFMDDWVLNRMSLLQPQEFMERGRSLGIDITLPRRVMVVSISNMEEYTNSVEGQTLIEQVENTLAGYLDKLAGDLILRNAARQILLIHKGSDEAMRSLAEKLCRVVEKQYNVTLAIGVDGGVDDVHQAYLQANKVWQAARISEKKIMFYEQSTLELFINEISPGTKKEYINKIFTGCSEEEISKWIELLEVYFSTNGSLQLTSDSLHIHKNTLQYQLKRLKQLSGYDVRELGSSSIFYMAIVFYKELYG